jgi:uncharacterized membrane protein YedE/YeeE
MARMLDLTPRPFTYTRSRMTMETFTPLTSLVGGALLGLAAGGLFLVAGRILGVSGILATSLLEVSTEGWRRWFVGGLVAGGAVALALAPSTFANTLDASPAIVLAAGVLAGYGSRLGSGCTSGHGVCGIPRLSPRSIVATTVFISAGALAVVAARHGLGVL